LTGSEDWLGVRRGIRLKPKFKYLQIFHFFIYRTMGRNRRIAIATMALRRDAIFTLVQMEDTGQDYGVILP